MTDLLTIENNELADEELLVLSLSKPALFGLLVSRYEDAFLRKVKRILGDREEVNDVVQDTFMKIYLNAARFKKQEGASFKSWAYKILINTTFTYHQKLKKTGEFSAHLDSEIWELIPDLSPGDWAKENLRDQIASVLSRMPKSLAQVLRLHFIDDVSQAEIARSEGVSVSAVKTRVHRAKKEFEKVARSLEEQTERSINK